VSAHASIRGVLFDLDGTLLDTAPDMVDSLNALRAEEHQPPLPFEAVRNFVSHGSNALVRLGFENAEPERFEVLRARFLELYRTRLTLRTRPFEGIPELLETLERCGLNWGIVTNKPGWLTEPLLKDLGLYTRAASVVSGDTLAQRKPHPAPLLHAARQLGVEPGACLYVGDAERDVLAAKAAGMRVLVASFGYIREEERPELWPADAWVEAPLGVLDWLESRAALQRPLATTP
jgi:2-phosphoglycolate phosphatase